MEVLYLSKLKSFYTPGQPGACPTDVTSTATLAALGKSPNQDKPEMRLAHTSDGVSFTDDGPVSINGIDNTDPTMSYTATRFIGPRGTIVQYINGSYGLFFSGGSCGDGDSDAYHYIGYADSKDGVNWVVRNGMTNPLVGVAPAVTLSLDGSSATMVFSGYNTPQPLPPTKKTFGVPTPNYAPTPGQTADYRTIMNLILTRTGAPLPCPPILADVCAQIGKFSSSP